LLAAEGGGTDLSLSFQAFETLILSSWTDASDQASCEQPAIGEQTATMHIEEIRLLIVMVVYSVSLRGMLEAGLLRCAGYLHKTA